MSAPRILCVHQGFELYGSDRTFVQSVRAVRRAVPDAEITAILPRPGPLSDALAPDVDRLEHRDLFVLRRAELRRPGAAYLRRGAAAIRAAARAIDDHDLTYVNTVVLADFVLGARLAVRPVVVHVHELPVGGLERGLFSGLLAASGAPAMFNSQATRDAFVLPPWRKTRVVHNGTTAPAAQPPPAGDGLPGRPLRVALLGRFNAWKGQALLVEAIARLDASDRARVEVRMAGDVFDGHDEHLVAVRAAIARHGLQDRIVIEGFSEDPDPIYAWADVVAVPSTKPEPFGLVAIEAMARGRAVIAANHGGLAEIVVDGHTGARFTPGDPASLAAAVRAYLADPATLAAHGAAGRRRHEAAFTENAYLDGIGSFASGLVRRTTGRIPT